MTRRWSRGRNSLIVPAACLLFVACSAPVEMVRLEPTTFRYAIPPAVKLEAGRTIAVLASRGDAGQTLQARLMEALQTTGVNVIDNQQLASIVQERNLKITAGDLETFGQKTNIDLFLIAERITQRELAIKILENDGRVGFAQIVDASSEDEAVATIAKIFMGYDRSFTDEHGFMFPKGDPNKDAVLALYNNRQFKEMEERLKTVRASDPSPLHQLAYSMNLANLYEIQERFPETLSALESAEQANQGLGITSGRVNPAFFERAKSLVLEMSKAATDAKTSSGSLTPRRTGVPKIAVLPFDAKAVRSSSSQASSESALEWIPAVYVSTKLAASNKYEVYDRDYFRALLETESQLSEKGRGELLGVEHLVYGKILSVTPVSRRPTFKKEMTSVQDPQTGQLVCCVEKSVLDNTQIDLRVSIQGRVVDVKTAFAKFQTFDRPFSQSFKATERIPQDGELLHQALEEVYGDIVGWSETILGGKVAMGLH